MESDKNTNGQRDHSNENRDNSEFIDFGNLRISKAAFDLLFPPRYPTRIQPFLQALGGVRKTNT